MWAQNGLKGMRACKPRVWSKGGPPCSCSALINPHAASSALTKTQSNSWKEQGSGVRVRAGACVCVYLTGSSLALLSSELPLVCIMIRGVCCERGLSQCLNMIQ